MNSKNKEIEILIAKKIRNIMESIGFPEMYGKSKKELFNSLQLLSALFVELFEYKDAEKRFKEIVNKYEIYRENNLIKLEVFEILRHITLHFPFFDDWNEIYLNKKLLNWNREGKPKGKIEKFFDINQGKTLEYEIYMKHYNEWIIEKTITIKVPKLYVYKKTYLKDIISLEDAIWTFATIDYYLDFMGYKIDMRASFFSA